MARAETRQIEVFIQGNRYVLTSDEPEAQVQEAAAVVDCALDEVTGGRAATSFHVAILTAMNIASELIALRCQHGDLKEDIDSRTQSLIELIDGRLTSSSRS